MFSYPASFVAQLREIDEDIAVRRYAARRARIVAEAVPGIDDLYPRELLHDVLTDTLTGVLNWKSDRKTLRQHVLDSMQSRSRHDFQRARRFQHYSILQSKWLSDAETTLASRDRGPAVDIEGMLDRLAAFAAHDDDVLLVASAYRLGHSRKRDILRATGLSHHRYDAARKRMLRALEKAANDDAAYSAPRANHEGGTKIKEQRSRRESSARRQ